MDTKELKPCPFCGGPVKLERAENTRGGIFGERKWWGVVCRNTINRGGACAIQQVPSASEEAAIARWNLRAPAAPAGAPDLRSAIQVLKCTPPHYNNLATKGAYMDGFHDAREAAAALASAAPVEAPQSGALNDALMRCCAELPMCYEIVVRVERGYGGVTFIDPDGNEVFIDGSEKSSFFDDVNEAFNRCVEDARAIEARIKGGVK